ncbi:Na(+)/H(+) antiporter NhaD [invertebrate metagenome]|uniref:Na(+)/H(+) antiporter NhaD n=1 Tax=invertebrate metagenome TaxID=1711999 RepID=A0A2H9TB86_9ZZZZ
MPSRIGMVCCCMSFLMGVIGFSSSALASEGNILEVTSNPLSWVCLVVFLLSYCAVIAEEKLKLRKSKPVILAAGIIWGIIAMIVHFQGGSHESLKAAVMYDLEEYASMFLFLLVAMTYINAMDERKVFAALRDWLINKGFSYRKLFWVTGVLAFFISPIADNMTTALLLGTVLVAVGAGHPGFVTLAMTNVVVCANAGGAFSPFGDITTLMVWQSGHVSFFEFFGLFFPALVNALVPALIMSCFIDKGKPLPCHGVEHVQVGGFVICSLFLVTVILAVTGENFLGLPPFIGMMTGLSLLMFYTYFLKIHGLSSSRHLDPTIGQQVDVYQRVAHAEWDTLFFFFGVIFSVGGLRYLGYLELVSGAMYSGIGASWSNVLAGVVSSVVDNIPVMFAIIGMNPEMDTFQWLLVTLTAGVGGSLLSVGSAAGVALMGASKGMYTFMSHLRWSWAIALGYVASISMHFIMG